MDKRLINIQEVADYLGLAKGTIYHWVDKRRIPYVKIGKCARFDLRRIDTWIEECSVEPIIKEDKTWENKNKPEIEKRRKKILDYTSSKKACSKCGKVKYLNLFHKDSWNKSGRQSQCKSCRKAEWQEKKVEARKGKAEQPRNDEDKQICKVCGKEKHIDEFYKDSWLKSGRSSQCKTCVRAKQAERDKAKKDPPQAEKKEEEKVPWAVGGNCEILNSKGEIIFKNGKAFGKEGEEWLRKKRLLEEKGNE